MCLARMPPWRALGADLFVVMLAFLFGYRPSVLVAAVLIEAITLGFANPGRGFMDCDVFLGIDVQVRFLVARPPAFWCVAFEELCRPDEIPMEARR